jgi:hypothetical protein
MLRTRLKILIWVVRAGVLFGAAVLLILPPLFWTNQEWVLANGFEMSGIASHEALTIDARARLLGALGTVPGTVAALFALWQLWRLFSSYAAGLVFAAETQRYLNRFAWALLIVAVLQPIERTWMSLAFTMGNPPGQQVLAVSLSSTDFLLILTSAVLLAVAMVLSEASRIAEENKQFV